LDSLCSGRQYVAFGVDDGRVTLLVWSKILMIKIIAGQRVLIIEDNLRSPDRLRGLNPDIILISHKKYLEIYDCLTPFLHTGKVEVRLW
jgi:hypothetical protein